jgi:hypothetical protein
MSALTSSNPDNANPTVHKTGNESSSTRSRSRLADFLDDIDDVEVDGWNEDEQSSRMQLDDDLLTYQGHTSEEDEDIEAIDSQEIFGMLMDMDMIYSN